MKFIALRELKIHPSKVLDRLRKHDVVVTRNGKPAAALVPLDEEALLASVAKTGRLVIVHEAPERTGYGAEIAAFVAGRGFASLKTGIRRVAARNVPLPMSPKLENAVLPQTEWIVDAVRAAVKGEAA